jgi:hypothetical protein
MDRFQGPGVHKLYTNTYHTKMLPFNGNVTTRSPSPEYTHPTSSLVEDPDDVITNGHWYVSNNSEEAIAIGPKKQGNLSSSELAGNNLRQGSDLAGVGVQFESYPWPDYTTPPCINDDVCLKSELS